MKVVVLVAIFLVSAYAEVTKQDRLRIQKFMLEESKKLAAQEIVKKEAFKNAVEAERLNSGKSGKCVEDVCTEMSKEGKNAIEIGYGIYIAMFKNVADAALTLDEGRMQEIKDNIDNGTFEEDLRGGCKSLQEAIDTVLNNLKESLQKCQ